MEAVLALEDGRVFRGRGYGAPAQRFGEVVFNTSLCGYQEILTDPSYAGQIVILTYPHIGNYGTNSLDSESSQPYAEGLVVRELCEGASNWRSEDEISNFLAHYGVPIISDIDTRALALHLRKHGAMRGVLSTRGGNDAEMVTLAKTSPSMVGMDLASRVSTQTRYDWTKPSGEIDAKVEAPGNHPPNSAHPISLGQLPNRPASRFRVIAYDYGIKQNILRKLVDAGCHVTVVPAATSTHDVLDLKPDGVFLSNGPGDPEPVEYAARAVRGLMGKVPVFGICLGHQIIGLALGGKTYKLKFGHHGGNHPVLNLETQKVEITAQNHGFAVDPDSLNLNEVVLTHRNLNDDTLEGLRHKSLPLFSVQYHPEASPGPHDSAYLFGKFVKMMEEFKNQS